MSKDSRNPQRFELVAIGNGGIMIPLSVPAGVDGFTVLGAGMYGDLNPIGPGQSSDFVPISASLLGVSTIIPFTSGEQNPTLMTTSVMWGFTDENIPPGLHPGYAQLTVGKDAIAGAAPNATEYMLYTIGRTMAYNADSGKYAAAYLSTAAGLLTGEPLLVESRGATGSYALNQAGQGALVSSAAAAGTRYVLDSFCAQLIAPSTGGADEVLFSVQYGAGPTIAFQNSLNVFGASQKDTLSMSGLNIAGDIGQQVFVSIGAPSNANNRTRLSAAFRAVAG